MIKRTHLLSALLLAAALAFAPAVAQAEGDPQDTLMTSGGTTQEQNQLDVQTYGPPAPSDDASAGTLSAQAVTPEAPIRAGQGVGLDGIDVSSHNPSFTTSNFTNYQFAIAKATESNAYINPLLTAQANKVLSEGKLLGVYHFLDGDVGAVKEAEFFVKYARPYIGKAILVLDWESAGAMREGVAYAETFLDTVYSLTGVKPLVYTSTNYARSYDWTPVVNAGYELWVANWYWRYDNSWLSKEENHDNAMNWYGYTSFEGYAREPRVSSFSTKWPSYRLYQYSSTGIVGLREQYTDLDKFYGTAADWASLAASSTSQPMFRLYNPNSGEHFYTASGSECDNLISVGWNYEGVGWTAPRSGSPVYRLYNPNAGDHHYTVDAGERDMLVSVGWNYEGVGWYSGGNVPLYREYNPNAVAGAHNYTTSKDENDHLVSLGWRYEGIGWYGL